MSASSECPNCKHSLPPHHSGPCPNCGSNVILKKDQEAGIGIDASASLEATTRDLTDEEFESVLRDALKEHLQEQLGAMKITKLDVATGIKAVKLKVSKFIREPANASVATAYLSLRSQEQQTDLNLKLQRLILYVAIGTLVTGLVTAFLSVISVILPYLYPH